MKQTYVDPYCYPGTNVLRNLLNIRDHAELDKVESVVTFSQALAVRIAKTTPSCDLAGLLYVHEMLFQTLFPFAGKLREHTGRMTKTRPNGSAVVYCDSAFVPEQIGVVFQKLAAEGYLKGLGKAEFASRAAYFYGELDAVHPFREGNSRTLRLFFAGVAEAAGFRFEWDVIAGDPAGRERLYAARDRAVMHGDSGPLASLFDAILTGV